MRTTITHIDTACVLIEINGYRILTDPTLDKAGRLYYHGYGGFSRKTGSPALDAGQIHNIDLVLLSHHQHKDNFDENGKKFTATVSTVLSTREAERSISGIRGLDDWETVSIDTPKVPGLTITATPAQHHPWWVPGFLAGKVIGFIIAFDGQDHGVIYIAGDTVYFKGIEEVARRYTIDTGIFNLGGVQFRYLTGFGRYTMDSNDLVRAVYVLNPRRVIPVHYKGWSHFKEKEDTLKQKIIADPVVKSKTIFLIPGKPTLL